MQSLNGLLNYWRHRDAQQKVERTIVVSSFMDAFNSGVAR
jgi:hypothetical protein